MRSLFKFNHSTNKSHLLKLISPITPYLAVGFGLYVIGNGWITFLLYHAGLICFIMLGGERRIFRKIFCGWDRTTGVAAIIICSLIGPLLCILWPMISIDPDGLSDQLGRLGLDGAGWITFIFFFVVLNPLIEEVYWRGFLRGKKITGWVTDILFAGYHLPVLAFFIKPQWLVLAFVVIFMGGWIWRWLTRKHGGFAVAFISHVVADTSIVLAVQVIAG